MESHGCHKRWENEGGAVVASGRERSNETSKSEKANTAPHQGKKMTWLQYAASKTPQKPVIPDWKQVLFSIRNGSDLSQFSNRRRSAL
ncbi:MAG: hypothetical protein WBD01_15645 [Salaquimonas sp.]